MSNWPHPCDSVGPHQCLREELLTCNFHSLAFRLVTTDFIFLSSAVFVLHHVQFGLSVQVQSVLLLHETRTRGLSFLSNRPWTVIFLHRQTCSGVLIEHNQNRMQIDHAREEAVSALCTGKTINMSDTCERLTCAMARKPYLTKDQACTASKILMSIFLQSQKTS